MESRVSEWRAWWAVFVLFLAYTLSFIDRSIISLLIEPMRSDLGLTDTQISLLQGLAFTIFYTTMALPISIIADRGRRPLLIGVGMFIWSAMTAACGYAANFVQLFLARMGVGLGEATLGPAAYSLIADLFPPEKRGRAMAIFSSGISIGAGLAFLIGGSVIELVGSGQLQVGFLAGMSSWQIVFILVGAPGMLGAFLLISVPEPRNRKERKTAKFVTNAIEPIAPFLKTHSRITICLFLTFAISGLIHTACLSWGPTLLIRQFGSTAGYAGTVIGAGLVVLGPLGALIGGWLSDRGALQANSAAPFRVGFIGIVLMSLALAGAVVAPSPFVSAACLVLTLFFGSFVYPAGATAVQALAPDRLRARFAALYLFVVTLVAATFGPTIVALVSDFIFADPNMIGHSLVATLSLTAPIGLASAFVGMRLMRQQTVANSTQS